MARVRVRGVGPSRVRVRVWVAYLTRCSAMASLPSRRYCRVRVRVRVWVRVGNLTLVFGSGLAT
jgi:hypothetical protein